MTRARILLADDHRIILDGLQKVLAPEFEIVGTVADGRELLVAAERLQPDVIVADISMPHLSGLEALRALRKAQSTVRVVLLTMHAEAVYAMNAFAAGASGYVLKSSASDELVTAIREALQGRTYITPLIAGDLMQAYQSGEQRQVVTVADLTERQQEVLRLLVKGRSIKEIAACLNISTKNAEYHKYRLKDLLGVKTTAELVSYAVQQGMTAAR